MAQIASEMVLRLADDASVQHVGDGAVVLLARSGQLYTCNGTTEAFLDKVDGARSLDQIVVLLSDEFEVDKDTLDQDMAGGTGPTTFVEDFEVANGPSGLGKFVLHSLDAGKNSLAASDGMRCQYDDPDGPSGSPRPDCYLGFAGMPDVNDWHLHTTAAIHGGVGRAYTGAKSLQFFSGADVVSRA